MSSLHTPRASLMPWGGFLSTSPLKAGSDDQGWGSSGWPLCELPPSADAWNIPDSVCVLADRQRLYRLVIWRWSNSGRERPLSCGWLSNPAGCPVAAERWEREGAEYVEKSNYPKNLPPPTPPPSLPPCLEEQTLNTLPSWTLPSCQALASTGIQNMRHEVSFCFLKRHFLIVGDRYLDEFCDLSTGRNNIGIYLKSYLTKCVR